jgi:hypothetical protein
MSTPKIDSGAAEHKEKRPDTYQIPTVDMKDASGNVVQMQAASVALAAAIAAQKPSPFSKSMLKLYFIMSVGYLVSTLNGFGGCLY